MRIHTNIIFKLKKDSMTRCMHMAALVKTYCWLDIRKYSFTKRTINNLNKIKSQLCY